MKIRVKRSRWPWGRPSIVVNINKNDRGIHIDGARWSVISD